jgi:hypothetical protein
MSLGENLSGYKTLEFLTGKTPDELKEQLLSIKLPYKIVSIYAVGSSHIAWIVPTVQLKKITKKG